MNIIKEILIQRLPHLAYFYGYLRGRIFISIGLNVAVGVLDGFGLSMFLPLLQLSDGVKDVQKGHGFNADFLADILKSFGFGMGLNITLAVIVLFFVLKGVANYLKGVYQVKLQQHFIKEIRFNNINGLADLDYQYFAGADAGQIQNTLTGEVDKVSRACQSYFQSFQHIVLVLVYVMFAFAADWKFAIMVALGGLISDLIFRQIYKNTKGISQKLTVDNGHFQGLISEFVTYFKYLKATAVIGIYKLRLFRQVNEIEEKNTRIGALSSLLNASREPLSIVVVAIVILVQVTLFNSHLGTLLISLLFFYRALGALMQLQTSWNSFLAVAGSLQHMRAFEKALAAFQERKGGIQFSEFKQGIELKEVTFEYDKKTVLHALSIFVRKNETIALVGESGGGKSTLVNLMSGLLKVKKGRILIDGSDINSLDSQSYKMKIGYITQEPVIFNDSIFNNVTLWGEKTPGNISKFENACKSASIWGFVISLPEGGDTRLGMAGINLSGGQKQRISIARELYKEIDLLILDEATSALDSQTEYAIQKSIEGLKGKITMVVIAHRLSTVRNADRVVCLEGGKITQVDSFSSLMATNDGFRKMVALQQMI